MTPVCSCHFLFLLHIPTHKNGSGSGVQRQNKADASQAQAVSPKEVGSKSAVEGSQHVLQNDSLQGLKRTWKPLLFVLGRHQSEAVLHYLLSVGHKQAVSPPGSTSDNRVPLQRATGCPFSLPGSQHQEQLVVQNSSSPDPDIFLSRFSAEREEDLCHAKDYT